MVQSERSVLASALLRHANRHHLGVAGDVAVVRDPVGGLGHDLAVAHDDGGVGIFALVGRLFGQREAVPHHVFVADLRVGFEHGAPFVRPLGGVCENARRASEANCRRHITITMPVVVSASSSGPRNQPR